MGSEKPTRKGVVVRGRGRQPTKSPPKPARDYLEDSQAPVDPSVQLVDQALLANFTHQIINPLNGVLGTLHNVIDGTVSVDRRPQRLRAVYAQLGVTVELVRNLAYLSQISTKAGRQSVKDLAVDVVLPKTIIEAAQFFQETGESKGMKIDLLNREAQYVVQGQAALLRQVFLNIFENGIKYGERKRDISVEMREQKSSRSLLVEIESYGDGFDPADAERLFELGFRGDTAKRILASGSGLGLYICRQILSTQDATISAEYSPKLRRVIFRIKFPHYRRDPDRGVRD